MAQRVSSPALVGRVAEVARLRAACDRARSGLPAAVVVAGEAGIGKTRLVGELVGLARADGLLGLTGGCLDVGDGVVPYAPVIEALRSLVEQLGLEEADRVLGGARTELTRLVPELGGSVEPASTLPPARLFELLLGVLHRLAADRAVLLAVEDLHWADSSTRHLLSFLVRNLRGGVVLVLTYRSDDLHRRHPLRPFLAELERGGRTERLELGRLDRGELRELLAGILGERPDAGLVAEIMARSEGNPFFAEELMVAHADGAELPDVLRDLLLARVETLPEETQRVLHLAVVAGRRVDHHLLAHLVAETTRLPPDRLVDLVREAVTHHVLVGEDGGEAYAFRHALVAEAVYDDLLPMQRVPLHAACARALASRAERADGHAPAAVLGQLAHHWYAAHDLGEALLASVRAGQAAEVAAALPEAQEHYQRALELWDQAPAAAARSPLDRRRLLRRAAQALAMVGNTGRAVTLINEALALTDPAAEPLLCGVLLERKSRYHWLDGDSPAAMATVEQALATIPAEPPSRERARALAAHGQMHMLQGSMRAARARCEEAIAVARLVGARTEEGHAINSLGVALTRLGHVADGIARLEEAYRIAKEVRDPEELARAPFNLSSTLLGTGRCAEAVTMALECVDLATRFGMLRGFGVTALGNGAEALAWLGRWDEADRMIERAFAIDPEIAAGDGAVLNARGKLFLWRGDPGAARADLATSVTSPLNTRDPQNVSPSLSAQARAAVWAGDAEDARAVVARALEWLAGIDDPWFLIDPCLAGLEAEAAIAERAAAARDTDELDGATRRAADLIRRARDAATADGVGLTPMARGLLLSAEAELSRVEGASDPARWAETATAWEELRYLWPSACARWRQAEALLAAGAARNEAAPPLRQAHATASRLGARLLLAEVESLARRARIDPAPEPANREGEVEPEPGPEDVPKSVDLGLTRREREVLELVAEGRTNRQIAAALFITDKTASVHVSNILAKLQVSNRAEAAAAAHRLGLAKTRHAAP